MHVLHTMCLLIPLEQQHLPESAHKAQRELMFTGCGPSLVLALRVDCKLINKFTTDTFPSQTGHPLNVRTWPVPICFPFGCHFSGMQQHFRGNSENNASRPRSGRSAHATTCRPPSLYVGGRGVSLAALGYGGHLNTSPHRLL